MTDDIRALILLMGWRKYFNSIFEDLSKIEDVNKRKFTARVYLTEIRNIIMEQGISNDEIEEWLREDIIPNRLFRPALQLLFLSR